MISLPLAFSLTHSVTEIGALVAIAGLLAIAVLSLLLFTQGKEITRLREWAGRAPERAAEAQARAGVPVGRAAAMGPPGVPAPSAGVASGAVSAVRPVPRATPLVSRDPEEGASLPDAGEAGGAPVAGAAAAVATQQPVAPATAAGAELAELNVAAEASSPAAAAPPSAHAAPALEGGPAVTGERVSEEEEPAEPESPAGEASGQEQPAADAEEALAPAPAAAVPAPSTAAGRDLAASQERAAIGNGASVAAAPAVAAPLLAASIAQEHPAAPAVAGELTDRPAPELAALAGPAVAESAGARSRPRRPPPPAARPHGDARGVAAAEPGGRPGERELRYAADYEESPQYRFLVEEPRGRMAGRLPLVAAVAVLALVAVVAVAVAVAVLSGESKQAPSGGAVSAGKQGAASGSPSTGGAGSAAVSPGALRVDVLNSTEINGLAHRLAGELHERGYSRAEAQQGHPPGSYTTSVVEYGPGYSAPAESVARALGIEAGAVRPLESAVQALAPGASVVLIAAASQEGASGATGTGAAEEPQAGVQAPAETAAGGTPEGG